MKKKIIILGTVLAILLVILIVCVGIINYRTNIVKELTVKYSFYVRPQGFAKNAKFSVTTEKYNNDAMVSSEYEEIYCSVSSQKAIKVVKFDDDKTKPTEIYYINYNTRTDVENVFNGVTHVDLINKTYELIDNYKFENPSNRIESYIANTFNTYNSNDFTSIALNNKYDLQKKDGIYSISDNENISFRVNEKMCIINYKEYDNNSYTSTTISTDFNEDVQFDDVKIMDLKDYTEIGE